MMIEQIIKKQTLSILDAILQTHSQSQPKLGETNHQDNRTFTPESYASLYVSKGVLKEDQKQILLILINQYVETQNSNNEFQQQEPTFTSQDVYVMLKSIKRSIIQQGQTEKGQKSADIQDKNVQKKLEQKLNTINIPRNTEKSSLDQPGKNTQREKNKQSTNEQNDQELGQMSKKLKKQNQFISRNIDRIKKYATNLSEAVLPMDRSQLQEIKISHEISHKLFQLYKPIYPSGMSNNKQIQMNNFQTKEQYKSTLNYHKILEMFIDAPIKLEIQNKLSLLRIIKKFSFNPNFIQLQEWTKIYRAIINNLGVKEIMLQRLVKVKEQEKKNNKLPISIAVPKQKPEKAEYRTRRIKTQVSIPENRLASLNNIDSLANPYQSQKLIQYMSNKSSIRPIEPEQKNDVKSYNPNEYRSRHKKLLTDVSEVFLKNVKKEMRSEKMIGLEEKKEEKNPSQVYGEEGKNEYSYLKKAIKSKKIGKITWESLFEMKEETMYHNIVIPEFAKWLDQERD